MPLRVIFMGTAELAGVSLLALRHQPELEVVAVVTQPDRPVGRHAQLQASPVKLVALQEQLPVLQPERARAEDFVAALRELRPDLIAVAAYGQILPPAILELPPHGCLNVHTSLLPKYRGASPIQSALLNDEPETGVTIMKMDTGMDTGPILTQAVTPIAPEDNAQTLHDRLAQLGAELLVRTIPRYAAGEIKARPQPETGASHAPKIKKTDGQLDWTQPARALWCRLRAFTPWPGGFTYLPATPHPRLLKIWRAEVVAASGAAGTVLAADKAGIVVACGQQALRIQELQLEGSRRVGAHDFLLGHSLPIGQKWA